MDTMEVIKTRRSVRSFEKRPLTAEDTEKLRSFIQTVRNPYDIPVDFVLLDAKAQGLSSPVIAGAPCFVAAKVECRMRRRLTATLSKSWCSMHGRSGSVRHGSAVR